MASLEIFGGGEDSEASCPSLTYTQRIIGVVICMVLGGICSIVSFVGIFNSDWTLFAVFFTLGNVFMIGGTMFMKGPKAQFKAMTSDTEKLVATVVFVLAMILTIIFAAAIQGSARPPLVICSVVVQFIAMIFYIISQTPGGCFLCKRVVGV